MSPLGAQSKDHRTALQMLLGTLRSNNADGNEDIKKKTIIGFISKTTTFLYISLPVFARIRRENA